MFGLRDHIFKENNILYPTALDILPAEQWDELRRRCDLVGCYCSFTPPER